MVPCCFQLVHDCHKVLWVFLCLSLYLLRLMVNIAASNILITGKILQIGHLPAITPVAVGKKTPNTVKKFSPFWYEGEVLL